MLHDKIASYIDKHDLIDADSTVIVGLSGGADSVALLYFLNTLRPRYNLKLIAAHLDHQWRANSSDDAVFCQSLAEKLGIEFVARTVSDLLLIQKISIRKTSSKEEQGRNLRRAFFEDIAQTYNAKTIALGHHADDQQETFFLRLIRGASVAGLAAMKPKNGLYIRPLLECSKSELIEYLNQRRQSHCEDSTNNDTNYLRNAIRHKVIPAFELSDHRFHGTFKKTLQSLQETDKYLEKIVNEHLAKIAHSSNGTIVLHGEELLKIDAFLHPRILVAWLSNTGVPYTPSTAFFNELMRFIRNSGKKHLINGSWGLKKVGPFITIERFKKNVDEIS